jgi:predicted naringenin-chalcone synthase
MTAARIRQITLANPESSFSQDEMLHLLGVHGNEFAHEIFGRCGVQKRHMRLSDGVLTANMQKRTQGTEQQLLDMAVEAIDALDTDPTEAATLITATYYSLGGPTLAHRLVEHYEMDPATDKYHVVGVGCASAVPLFKLARQALRDHPERGALVVAAESVSGFISRVAPGDGKVKIVGSSLFGDGCAAALLTADPGADGPEIVASTVHQFGGTLDDVRFMLEADDSYMQIGRDLPVIAAEELGELVDIFLGGYGFARGDVDHWLVHPGGRGIIEGVQRGLELTHEDVAVSFEVLANFGNMGTPSSFFVLKTAIDRRSPAPGDTGLMVTIGPGVTIGLMLLRW